MKNSENTCHMKIKKHEVNFIIKDVFDKIDLKLFYFCVTTFLVVLSLMPLLITYQAIIGLLTY